MPTQLICPRCAGLMRTYHRSGVEIDQCSQCLGIFLDRGELAQLIDAEAAYLVPQPLEPATPAR